MAGDTEDDVGPQLGTLGHQHSGSPKAKKTKKSGVKKSTTGAISRDASKAAAGHR